MTLLKHPKHGVILELGKKPILEEVFEHNKENKDFKSLGYVERIKWIELPSVMGSRMARQWINNNPNLMKELDKLMVNFV